MNQSRAETRGVMDLTSAVNMKRCCPAAGGQLVVEAVDGKLSIGPRRSAPSGNVPPATRGEYATPT